MYIIYICVRNAGFYSVSSETSASETPCLNFPSVGLDTWQVNYIYYPEVWSLWDEKGWSEHNFKKQERRIFGFWSGRIKVNFTYNCVFVCKCFHKFMYLALMCIFNICVFMLVESISKLARKNTCESNR